MQVVELLTRKLENEPSFHRRVDLFFLVDSITQCSHSHKGKDSFESTPPLTFLLIFSRPTFLLYVICLSPFLRIVLVGVHRLTRSSLISLQIFFLFFGYLLEYEVWIFYNCLLHSVCVGQDEFWSILLVHYILRLHIAVNITPALVALLPPFVSITRSRVMVYLTELSAKLLPIEPTHHSSVNKVYTYIHWQTLSGYQKMSTGYIP